MTLEPQAQVPIHVYKYKIEQTRGGARVTCHGDQIDEVVYDYMEIRGRLEANGFKIAPESGNGGGSTTQDV